MPASSHRAPRSKRALSRDRRRRSSPPLSSPRSGASFALAPADRCYSLRSPRRLSRRIIADRRQGPAAARSRQANRVTQPQAPPPADTTAPETTITSAPADSTIDRGQLRLRLQRVRLELRLQARRRQLGGLRLAEGLHRPGTRDPQPSRSGPPMPPATSTPRRRPGPWSLRPLVTRRLRRARTPPDRHDRTRRRRSPAARRQHHLDRAPASPSPPASRARPSPASSTAAAGAPATRRSRYSGLGVGSHPFSVRATDAAGNVDTTPATQSWTVEELPPPPADTTAPDTSITSGPPPAPPPPRPASPSPPASPARASPASSTAAAGRPAPRRRPTPASASARTPSRSARPTRPTTSTPLRPPRAGRWKR